MRRLRSLPLALAGLACLLPSSARAGLPGLDSTCAGQPRTKVSSRHAKAPRPPRLCPDCQAKMLAQTGQPAPVVISGTPTAIVASGPCSACEIVSPSSLPPSSPPGFAVVGDGASSPMMASSGGEPGYAVTGGLVASAEPAPIGVVQTNYQTPPVPGTLGESVASARRGAAGPGPIPYARPDELPPSLVNPPTHRRPRVLSRVIGLPDFGRRRADAQARAREAHARSSLGAGSMPGELPASMVYGGR